MTSTVPKNAESPKSPENAENVENVENVENAVQTNYYNINSKLLNQDVGKFSI